MGDTNILDAHQRPPASLRALFKQIQKTSDLDLSASLDVLDFANLQKVQMEDLERRQEIEMSALTPLFTEFLNPMTSLPLSLKSDPRGAETNVFELKAIPGLFILPSLLPPIVQVGLLSKLLHRDLANPRHKTNLDLHYHIPRGDEHPQAIQQHECELSVFAFDLGRTFAPKDPSVHKSISVKQVLEKKLRWITLGGQYDWTAKKYPEEIPPTFPEDIGNLLKGLFPDVNAQAAIVNLFSPGDTLSVHRDVSEECDRGLISLSIGCDGIFILGNENGSQTAAIRLRSGDAILMTGESRFAWHAVPKVVPETCPDWLQDWPSDRGTKGAYENWRGWMRNKRININVRQMKGESFPLEL